MIPRTSPRASIGLLLLGVASFAAACSTVTTSPSATGTTTTTSGAGGAGGGAATCTVTRTAAIVGEGARCGPPANVCEPGTTCDIGLYCAGSTCDQSMPGVCTRAPASCAADLGPAVRGCNGSCYATECDARKAGQIGAIDPTCPGSGGAGGGTPTCTVTNTILQLGEGEPCNLPPGPCDPGSACNAYLGLYCKGSTCAPGVSGVCTKAAADCSGAPGPAVRGCNGLCYANACLANQAGVVGDADPKCDVAGAGGAGGGG